jgi:hypothetical protein
MSTQTDGSTSEAQVDFTKTRTYAITDLAIKAVSAAAIAVIGLASYCYQSHLEAGKKLETEREKKAELLLPFLRSSSEVAVVVNEVSTRYAYPSGDQEEADEKAELGGRLSDLAASIQFPDKEPMIDLVPASDIINDSAAPPRVMVPARAALMLLVDLLRLAPIFNDEQQKKAVVSFQGHQLKFERPDKTTKFVTVGDRSVTAWRAWMPPARVAAEDIYEIDLPTIADLITEELMKQNDAVVLKNRDLAKDYVGIRSDVIRNRTGLIPPRAPRN